MEGEENTLNGSPSGKRNRLEIESAPIKERMARLLAARWLRTTLKIDADPHDLPHFEFDEWLRQFEPKLHDTLENDIYNHLSETSENNLLIRRFEAAEHDETKLEKVLEEIEHHIVNPIHIERDES